MATRPTCVSTGSLPDPESIRAALAQAHARYAGETGGANADYIPALAGVARGLFGIALTGVSGETWCQGDTEVQFSIQSVSKPFVFGLICQAIGEEEARLRLGVNSTGLPFNSAIAVERSADGLTNPMVNSGAIAATSLAPGETAEAKWRFVQEGLSRFAGRPLALDLAVYRSEAAANRRNLGIATLLQSWERIYFDPVEATDVYTRQCALSVTARDLAVMAATLANGGVNPLTGEAVIDPIHCQHVLAVMVTAGLYEGSGDWLYATGLPGKSGVSGGMILAIPGKGGLATFAPPLDASGNSVKGQLVARHLSESLGLNLFASRPLCPARPETPAP
jgi:glutaminase